MNSDTKANLLARLASGSASDPQVEDSLNEPVKAETRRPSPKPSAKTNMVAREVRVNVTGLQPGKMGGERELFTEEASSVLVHEKGGVIQLSSSVARGQLVLVANVESKREVVAQVKRTYEPMNRCVELEFAEPAPRFWGTEFTAAAALLPKAAKDAEAAALLSGVEGVNEPSEPLAPPSVEEVHSLQREIDALRGKAGSPAETAESPAVEQNPVPTLTAEEEAQLPKPALDFSIPDFKATRVRAKGKFMPGAKLRLALLTTALVIVVAGTMWFKHWSAGKVARKEAASVPAVGASVTTSPQTGRRGEAKEHLKAGDSKVAGDAQASLKSKSTPSEESSPNQDLEPSISVVQPAPRKASTASTVARAEVRAPVQTNPVAVAPAAVQGVVVPPKLIKSVAAVASLDNLRDFETGHVVIDAVVGTEGEVHLITVLSGPPSLRAPAVAAVKQYRYEPATRNGQPVPEHVHITVRFRFES